MEQPIRVLIADDSAMMRRALEDLVGAQSDMEVIGTAVNGHEAVRRATELQPDVVLMDIHMPDMDGIQATWLVSSKVPHGGVVMVTSEERIDFLQKAMAAGAQGYVLKPFGDGAELLATVRDVSHRQADRRVRLGAGSTGRPPGQAPPKIGRRIAVFGAKGGVGKTTLAVSLGIGLHQQTNGSVVLFDADFLFGDAAVHLDLPTQRSMLDLVPYIDALDSALIDQVIAKHSSGIHLLPRPARPEQADVINAEHVRAVLSTLATMYDYVVIDTQPSYDERMLAVLDLADVYVIVLAPDLGPLRNTRHFLDVARSLGYPEERMCFVLNRGNSLAGLTMDDICGVVGTRRVLSLPSAGVALSRSINDGEPLVIQDPRSPFSRAVNTVVELVRVLAAGTESPTQRLRTAVS